MKNTINLVQFKVIWTVVILAVIIFTVIIVNPHKPDVLPKIIYTQYLGTKAVAESDGYVLVNVFNQYAKTDSTVSQKSYLLLLEKSDYEIYLDRVHETPVDQTITPSGLITRTNDTIFMTCYYNENKKEFYPYYNIGTIARIGDVIKSKGVHGLGFNGLMSYTKIILSDSTEVAIKNDDFFQKGFHVIWNNNTRQIFELPVVSIISFSDYPKGNFGGF